ncbi:prolipoprotein diacylglyceryl transferase [Nafulsella turpanensis]|uniref:prolipoprotein diacylglyceryl transferase n=1 Tax=Nafulsella turpanensis TaxID=1265690 RepID=UPI00034564D7|nr:prolipoprotein diacylglyceryl transferase [Nafulsella turpanensis]
MLYLNYIVWDPQPEIFNLGGWEMRWYGLLFALGFLISQQIMFYIYRKEGKPERDVEALTFFMVIATILGARLGHVLFYEPDKYLSRPLEILKIWEGGLASHGAAIGILLAIYLYVNYLIRIDFGTFEVKKRKRPGQNYMWVVDRLVIVVAFTGALIRLGNFINSEIVGEETSADYGVVFARDAEAVLQIYGQGAVEDVEARKIPEAEGLDYPMELEVQFARGISEEVATKIIEESFATAFLQSERLQADVRLPATAATGAPEAPSALTIPEYRLEQERGIVTATILAEGIPRHPAQLYESISSFLIFLLLFFIWNRKKAQTPPGLIFGIFLIVLFGLRFVYEFFKENQVAFEDQLPLNMGQILSIPLVLAGIIILFRSFKQKKEKEEPLTTSKP